MKNIISVLVTSTTLVLFCIGAQAQSSGNRHMEKRSQNSINEQYNNANNNDQYAQNNVPYNQARNDQYGQQNNGYKNNDQNQRNGYDNNEYGRGNNDRYDREDRNSRNDRYSKGKRMNDRRGSDRSYESRGNSCGPRERGRY